MIKTILTIADLICFGIAVIFAVYAIFLIIKGHIDYKRAEKEVKEEEARSPKCRGLKYGF